MSTELTAEAYVVIEGRHSDPFHYLGPHIVNAEPVVRVFLPDAARVDVITEKGAQNNLTRLHDAGLFAGLLPDCSTRYHLRAQYGDKVCRPGRSISFPADPHRFRPLLAR